MARYELLKRGKVVAASDDRESIYAALRLLWRTALPWEFRYRDNNPMCWCRPLLGFAEDQSSLLIVPIMPAGIVK
jgi:hypothetical protein